MDIRISKVIASSLGAILIFSLLLSVPLIAHARVGDGNDCKVTSTGDAIRLNIQIPGVTEKIGDAHYIKNLGCYIVGIYRYFASIAGILAAVMIMYGGIKYVISFGSQQKIADAKETIVAAMLGLALTLSSYMILYFINPNLVKLDLNLGAGIEGVYSDTIWCEDYTDAVPHNSAATSCGDRGTVIIGGKNITCIYSGNCSEKVASTICTPWGTGYQCKDAKLICDEFTQGGDDCKKVDAQMIRNGLEGFACSRITIADLGPYGNDIDRCLYGKSLECSGDNWIRIKCEEGETGYEPVFYNGDKRTCWYNGLPGYLKREVSSAQGLTGESQRYTCTDGTPTKGAGSLCCAETKDVDCKDEGDCNDNELESKTCIFTLNGVEKNFKHKDSGGEGGTTSCTDWDLEGDQTCCLQIELRR